MCVHVSERDRYSFLMDVPSLCLSLHTMPDTHLGLPTLPVTVRLCTPVLCSFRANGIVTCRSINMQA